MSSSTYSVLCLSHIFPPAVDGGSQIIFNLGQQLEKRGYLVDYFSGKGQSTDDYLTPISQFLKHISLIGPILKIGPIFSPLTLYKLARQKPQIILAGPLPTTIALYAYFLKIITDAKLVLVPCYHPTDTTFNNPIFAHILQKSNLVLTLTNYEKNLLQTSNCQVLPPGINANLILKTKPSFPKTKNILFLGNFAAHKQIILLLQAFAKLKINCTLTIAGKKTLYYPEILKYLHTLPKSIQTKINIIDSGYNPDQLIHLLNSCTLMCLPSSQESFGIVFAEAWARGKPVVGSDIPAVSELFKQTKGGLTFKNLNTNSLCQTLEKLLLDPQLCQKLGENGHSYVRQHLTWDKIGNQLCAILPSLF